MIDIFQSKPSGCLERVPKQVSIPWERCNRTGCSLIALAIIVRRLSRRFDGVVIEVRRRPFLARGDVLGEQIEYHGTVRDFCRQKPAVDANDLARELLGLGWDVILDFGTREQNQFAQLVFGIFRRLEPVGRAQEDLAIINS